MEIPTADMWVRGWQNGNPEPDVGGGLLEALKVFGLGFKCPKIDIILVILTIQGEFGGFNSLLYGSMGLYCVAPWLLLHYGKKTEVNYSTPSPDSYVPSDIPTL
jgi:hypothetical protein